MYLRDPEGQHRAVARALREAVSTLVEEMHSLCEHPAAVRFLAVETMTARELYFVLTYGEAVPRQAPSAYIVTTKGIGSLTINDPLLKSFNVYLLSGKEMMWQGF
jgi:hypothetical protein